jgi:hypothetical protein
MERGGQVGHRIFKAFSGALRRRLKERGQLKSRSKTRGRMRMTRGECQESPTELRGQFFHAEVLMFLQYSVSAGTIWKNTKCKMKYSQSAKVLSLHKCSLRI